MKRQVWIILGSDLKRDFNLQDIDESLIYIDAGDNPGPVDVTYEITREEWENQGGE